MMPENEAVQQSQPASRHRDAGGRGEGMTTDTELRDDLIEATGELSRFIERSPSTGMVTLSVAYLRSWRGLLLALTPPPATEDER